MPPCGVPSRLSKPAYVVGSGPNGLTAAIVLALAGVAVTLIEARPTLGGGARSAALTLPGFVHDICSAAHPMAVSSPAFDSFPLQEHGLDWIQPPAALAHPLEDGSALLLHRSVDETARQFGPDEARYRRLLTPLTTRWPALAQEILAPLHLPAHPLLLARFGALAAWPATWAARALFKTAGARAFFAGIAAHSILPLEQAGSGAFGWVLAVAGHAAGWPIARGGSQSLTNALAAYFQSLGGRIVTDTTIRSLDELPHAGLVLLDITPRQLLRLAGDRLPARYRARLARYRYGPGVFKMDWALDAPIPWRAEACAQAATVHVGATLEEIAASERAPWQGRTEPQPFVLVTQPSLFDPSRAPAGRHTAWAYCHVPHGATEDASARIEQQIERFAPGFRDRILARSVLTPAALEQHNPNLIGGDISGGAADLRQLFLRPTPSLYRTPLAGVYLCSSSTPPGGGVHGMCGYHAAQQALSDAHATDETRR